MAPGDRSGVGGAEGAHQENRNLDDSKVANEFDRRAGRQPDLNAVLDAHDSDFVRRGNRLRDYVSRSAVSRIVDPGRRDIVLDLGCGVGRLSFDLARRAQRLIGVDVAPNMIEAARARLKREPRPNVEFLHATGLPLPVPDQSVDKAFTNWTLAHVSDDRVRRTLADAHRCLRPGGRFFAFEQVRSRSTELSEIHKQRSPEEYISLFEGEGYRFLRRQTVIRSPSYALGLWNSHQWLPDLALPFLDAVERLTAERKLENAEYLTVAFTFERP